MNMFLQLCISLLTAIIVNINTGIMTPPTFQEAQAVMGSLESLFPSSDSTFIEEFN